MCARVCVCRLCTHRNEESRTRKRAPMRSRIQLAYTARISILRTDSLSISPGLEPRPSYFYHRARNSIAARYGTVKSDRTHYRDSPSLVLSSITLVPFGESRLYSHRFGYSPFGVAHHPGYVRKSIHRME